MLCIYSSVNTSLINKYIIKGLYFVYLDLYIYIYDLFLRHDCRTWDAWRFHRMRSLQNLALKMWMCNVQSCKPLRHCSSLSCIFVNVLSLGESDSFSQSQNMIPAHGHCIHGTVGLEDTHLWR